MYERRKYKTYLKHKIKSSTMSKKIIVNPLKMCILIPLLFPTRNSDIVCGLLETLPLTARHPHHMNALFIVLVLYK